MTIKDESRTLAAKGWFGYGRWDAPYWFVGMEPGGIDDPVWYETWLRLGGTELCDCRAHHIGANYHRWHRDRLPATQPTWRPLIQLLLAYKDESQDLNALRAYQRDKWGRLDGETALAEISAIRARSNADSVERTMNREHRINVLKQRLVQYQPIFVVFYGTGYTQLYEGIVGSHFGADGYCSTGKTLCILVPHPVARNMPAGYWTLKGQEIAGIIQSGVGKSLASERNEPNLKQRAAVPGPPRDYPCCNGGLPMAEKSKALPTDIIRVLIKHNPRRVGSKSLARFACLKDGMTVAEYEAAVIHRLGKSEARKCKFDLQWDFDRGIISLARNGRRVDLLVSPSMQRP